MVATRIDLDRLELAYSGTIPSPPPCPKCGADLELAFREDNGLEEWHCSNVPSHIHLQRVSNYDKNVLVAARELRDRRKDEIGYQKMIRQAINLINGNDIDDAVELLQAWEDNDG